MRFLNCRSLNCRFFKKLYFSRAMSSDGKFYYPDGSFVYYKQRTGNETKPGIIFCSGYASSLNGNKAQYLDSYCEKNKLAYVRFDYVGHEFSSGTMYDANLSMWKRNLLDVLENLSSGPQILVGSSIGGWLSLLGAIEKPERVHSVVGIANATDLMYRRYNGLSQEMKAEIERVGHYVETTGVVIPLCFFKDCKKHVLLESEKSIPINCPIRLIHGMQDDVVSYETSTEIAEKVESKDVLVHLVKNGDHRMSEEKDLKLLETVLDELLDFQ